MAVFVTCTGRVAAFFSREAEAKTAAAYWESRPFQSTLDLVLVRFWIRGL
jgi:hypothetical protein